MRDNDSTIGTQSEEKPKKMTRAEFMVAFDEMNVEIQKNIVQARENQREIEAKSKELSQKIAETRKFIEAL